MIWAPLALALLFGIAVSLALYFVFLWPRREPEEPGGPERAEERGDAGPPED